MSQLMFKLQATPVELRSVCPHDRQTRRTDGRTPDRYSTLSARLGHRKNQQQSVEYFFK